MDERAIAERVVKSIMAETGEQAKELKMGKKELSVDRVMYGVVSEVPTHDESGMAVRVGARFHVASRIDRLYVVNGGSLTKVSLYWQVDLGFLPVVREVVSVESELMSAAKSEIRDIKDFTKSDMMFPSGAVLDVNARRIVVSVGAPVAVRNEDVGQFVGWLGDSGWRKF